MTTTTAPNPFNPTVALLTEDQFKKVLPANYVGSVNPVLVGQINQLLVDPKLMDHFRENVLGLSNVLKDGKFKLVDYINAVRFVTYKAMGDLNSEAYTKTFPDRYQRLINEGTSTKDISSYVAAYNKTKLVTLLDEQLLVPVHLQYMDKRHKALSALFELGISANSEKVKSDSLDRFIAHTTAPVSKGGELVIKSASDSGIQDIATLMREVAEQNRQLIAAGHTDAKTLAHRPIVVEAYKEKD